MNTVAHTVEMLAEWPFILWAPIVLIVRWVYGSRFPWWAVGILLAVGGWMLCWGGIQTEIECQQFQLTHGQQPPAADLIKRHVNDNGRNFAQMFAPVYAVMYSGIWVLLFGVAKAASLAFRKKP